MYMSSPVLSGNLLFGFSHKSKGQFFCLDANTGKTQWAGDPRQGDNAAILQVGQRLLLLKDDAELIIAQVSAKAFEPLRRYKVAYDGFRRSVVFYSILREEWWEMPRL